MVPTSSDNRGWTEVYFSKQLQAAKKQYSTFDRELLAIYQEIKHFCNFVECRQFMVLTDHKPLTHAFSWRVQTSIHRGRFGISIKSLNLLRIYAIYKEAQNQPADVLFSFMCKRISYRHSQYDRFCGDGSSPNGR